MEETEFRPGSVPVCVAARVYGKDASWVRAGIIVLSEMDRWEQEKKLKELSEKIEDMKRPKGE